MVVTWSKAGPLMHRACTSEEIVSGRKPLASMARARLEGERPPAVADVEAHPAGPRRQHLPLDRALGAHRRIGEGAEGVGQDVAGPDGRATTSS